MPEPHLYPVFLKVAGRAVLVAGAGTVAARRIEALVGAGARVRVVAPRADPAIERLARTGAIEWLARGFEETDVDGSWFVVASTDDLDLQRRIAAAAEARRVFVLAVDDPANATAYGGAIVRRDPFTIVISSSGETPALTRLIREVVEQVLPSDGWIAAARELRRKWRTEAKPMGERFGDLVRELASRQGR